MPKMYKQRYANKQEILCPKKIDFRNKLVD